TLLESGQLGPEWNTLICPAGSTARPPCLDEPLTLMGLVLWRRTGLVEWLNSESSPAADFDETLCESLSTAFQDAASFVQVSEPQVIIHQVETTGELHARAQAAAEAGDLDAALQLALESRQRFGCTQGLRCRMARWLIKAERHAQAVPLLYASLKTGNGQRENHDLLASSIPHVLAGKGEFKNYWTAVNKVLGYMAPGQEEYLHNKVKSLPLNARIIEIGSFHGRSTVAMGYACAGTSRRIVCIDSFCGNEGQMGHTVGFYHLWRGNLRQCGLESYAEGRTGYSHPQLRAMAGSEMFDFAFIDASHEYADVLLDFELVYPHVKPGGWIAFHDVEPGWPGSWRVWEQTGKRLLADHEVCSTISCGRKQADVEWRSYESEWPGFRVTYARNLQSIPDLAAVAQALLDVATLGLDDLRRKDVEGRIAAAPERVRNELRWGVTKEQDADPWVHYCAGLAQQAHSPENAAQHFAEARRLGCPL
ncbi:MAG: glycosyltransferase, partial [Verrucomicrobiaceae bacterium]|nr:glycosyltransferase [Verrucomicrobiaceae bacterium]